MNKMRVGNIKMLQGRLDYLKAQFSIHKSDK